MKFVSIIVVLLLAISRAQQTDYTDIIKQLKEAIADQAGQFHHKAFDRLAFISDKYGPRMWGSQALEKVIHVLYRMALDEKFENVRLEAVKNFTKWVRGPQSLILHKPRTKPTRLKLIGLGGSVSGYVKANAIVVSSYDDLQNNKDKVPGKIVVYNPPWKTYGETVKYRSAGAARAAQYGAIGALVRSITPQSIESVHAGIQHYSSSYPKIPFAAIATEDAEMLARMQARGQQIVLELNMSSKQVPNTYSNNLVFQIKGSKYPEQILLMGGHIDSWDTGSQTGANDDGGGFISCFQAMRLLLKQKLRPKRTIRFIAWSGEQWGDPRNGANAYVEAHKWELKNHIVAFEDDLGSTKLQGFGISGNQTAFNVVKGVADQYMELINAKNVSADGEAVDTGPLYAVGIPTMVNLVTDDDDNKFHKFYFTYHHSAGDSMTIMNADDLDSNVLGIASMFYILADLENSIPLPNIKMDKVEQIIQKYKEGKRA